MNESMRTSVDRFVITSQPIFQLLLGCFIYFSDTQNTNQARHDTTRKGEECQKMRDFFGPV